MVNALEDFRNRFKPFFQFRFIQIKRSCCFFVFSSSVGVSTLSAGFAMPSVVSYCPLLFLSLVHWLKFSLLFASRYLRHDLHVKIAKTLLIVLCWFFFIHNINFETAYTKECQIFAYLVE